MYLNNQCLELINCRSLFKEKQINYADRVTMLDLHTHTVYMSSCGLHRPIIKTNLTLIYIFRDTFEMFSILTLEFFHACMFSTLFYQA